MIRGIQESDKTELIKLRISPEFKDRIRKQAKARGISLSDVMRRGVELVEKEGATVRGVRQRK